MGGGVPAGLDVHLGLPEDLLRELLDQLLDVDGADVEHLVLVLQPDNLLALPVLVHDLLRDLAADHARQGLLLLLLGLAVGGELVLQALVDGVLAPRGQVLAHVGGALEGVAVVVALLRLGAAVDEHQVVLELVLDEFLVVEDLAQVLLGVVVELRKGRTTMVRKSLKAMPPFLSRPLLKNLKSRLIFSFSVDLKILAAYPNKYRSRG